MKYRVYLDLDEVIFDFREGARTLHGLSEEEMHERFGGRGGRPYHWWSGSDFALPIVRAGIAFWINLPLRTEALSVIETVKKFDPNFYFLTSPFGPLSYTGKVISVKKLLGRDFHRIYITPTKEDKASERACLIDDSTDNIANFTSQGGTGILYPSYYNEHRPKVGSEVSYLENRLSEIYKGESDGTNGA